MVGHQHPSLWALLNALQQDQAMVATALLQHMRGQPPAKRTRKAVEQQQQRLHKLCCERCYVHSATACDYSNSGIVYLFK